LVMPISASQIRMVTHLDISSEMVQRLTALINQL
jgi:threonine aldolase